MTQHEFDLLTEKYLQGQCNPTEVLLLEQWAEEQKKQPLIVQDAASIEERLWQRIESSIHPIHHWRWVSIAAAIVLVIGYFVFWHDRPNQPGIESKNTATTRQKIMLPDGSMVILEKNASLITDQNYGKANRTVFLTGEAFFDVKKDKKMPFLVHTGDLIAEVLGTRFRIKPSNKSIEVAVSTGAVSVYTPVANRSRQVNGVILKPNQRIVFDTELQTISQSIVEKPVIVTPTILQSDFIFDETTLEKVLAVLQKAYGIDILVANPSLSSCTFTGNLNELDMHQQLALICGTINAEYEVRGSTIFIIGNSCQ